jgi:hypothetical protein
LNKLNDGYKTYDTKITASLKGKITSSEAALGKYVNDLMPGDKNAKSRKDVKMFGSIDAIANTTSKLYYTKDGNLVLEDRYKDMGLTAKDSSGKIDYTKNSWAKVIAENVFDIDTT